MDVYLGMIIPVAFNFAPPGWALCNGQLLPINQNQALFVLLSTTYGGDGRTTFGLPNLQGRVPIHFGQGASSYTLGQTGGVEGVTLLTPQLPSHNHGLTVDAVPGTGLAPAGSNLALVQDPAKDDPFNSFTTGAPTKPATLNPAAVQLTGGNQPHENRQPFIALNFIIATQGIFPPRP